MSNLISEKILWSVCLIFSLGLSACGPVKFSASSSTSTNGTTQVTPSPTGTTAANLRDVHYTNTVAASNNKVDIILILDDSNSMLADNQKLASKLSNFVSSLQSSNLDWQACVTVTHAISIGNGQTAWGASHYWQSSSTYSPIGLVLKKGQSNLSSIFANTINYIGAGWLGTDDERAIKTAYYHVANGDYHFANASGCYRSDAAIAYIIISDEDERSVGGDQSQAVYANEYQPLENEDMPANFVTQVKSVFGSDKRFTVNSIIVKPGDSNCMATQDSGGSKSHYGTKYNELSYLTGGGIGSICEDDFSTNLNLFADKIIGSLSSVPLECTPAGDVSVSITPSIGAVQATVQGMTLAFDKAIPAGRTIDIQYQCSSDSRSPSSVKGGNVVINEEGFFARMISFIKGLF